ncbi:Cox19-like CHCH family protein [Zea mays]|uniref:Cox19-like CHCH family protein n=1 Tax=Zea mays TaxID=4577 RepID=A0A1D6KZK6_MAIZE|nr:Cox19-like CHCH family protein [Zea mays]
MFGGIGSTIAQGMAFGTGSAMAHRAVDSVLGPRTIQHETLATEAPAAAPAAPAMNADACSFHSKAFQDVCLLATLCSLIFPQFDAVVKVA